MPKKALLIGLVSSTLLLLGNIFLSTWSFGLDGDHTGYWQYSWITPMGDFDFSGKSPVFYQINYFITHVIGPVLGNRQSLAIVFFYQIVTAISFSYVFVNKFKNAKDSLLPAVALWVSPLFYFNLTQFMMETPLILIVFILAYHLDQNKLSMNRKNLFIFFVILFFSISLKESVVPAVILLIVWQTLETKFNVKYASKLFFTLLGAFVLFKIIINHYQNVVIPYRVTLSDVTPELISQKTSYLPRVIVTYLCFITPAIILGFLSASRIQFLIIALSGLILTVMLHFMSILNSQRYYSPIVVAVLSLAFLRYLPNTIKVRNGAFISIIFINLIMIGTNFYLEPFTLWPKTIKREHIESGGSVFYGFPIYRWLMLHGQYKDQLCIYVPMENGEMNYYIERSFPGVFGSSAKVIHTSLADAKNCPNTGIMYRSYTEPSQVLYNFCRERNLKIYEGRHRISYFSLEGHKSEDNPGYLFNLTCI